MVKDIAMNLGDGMSAEDIDSFMESMGDDDHDGTISYAEIMNIIKNNKDDAMFSAAKSETTGMGTQNLKKRSSQKDTK